MEVTVKATDDLGKNKWGGVMEAKAWLEWVQEHMVGEESELAITGLAV